MKLSLTNIGKIGAASVEISGITVIAGENNTGKSTVGKALYCLFSAFHHIGGKIDEERSMSVYRSIYSPVRRRSTIKSPKGLYDFSQKLCADRQRYMEDPGELRDVLEKFYESLKISQEALAELDIESIFNRVLSYLKMDDVVIKANVLKKVFDSEYNMQVGHVNFKEAESSISLEIHGEKVIDIAIRNSGQIEIRNSVDIYSNLAYIEDPFVIDELANGFPAFIYTENHRGRLVEMLRQKRGSSVVGTVIEEIAVSEKLRHIFDILNGICEGSLSKAEDGYAYASSKYEEPLSLSNISTGLKTFLTLKTLLMNGSIEEDGTIILDEPEIHLHPEWQLLLAEVIVLIQKEFGVHVLLNTHSPYFLRAIQVYSAKYEIADMCRYYLSEIAEGRTVITDVTESIEKIYVKLSRPLQKLEDGRWQDD